MPNILIDDFISKLYLKSPGFIEIPKRNCTARIKTKSSILKDLIKSKITPVSISEQDQRKLDEFYDFRTLYDEIIIVFNKMDKNVREVNNLKELISKNSDSKIRDIQQSKLKIITSILEEDFRGHTMLLEEIYELPYRRIGGLKYYITHSNFKKFLILYKKIQMGSKSNKTISIYN